MAAPKLWNALLLNIRLASSVPVFKSLLKTDLFSVVLTLRELTFAVLLDFIDFEFLSLFYVTFMLFGLCSALWSTIVLF